MRGWAPAGVLAVLIGALPATACITIYTTVDLRTAEMNSETGLSSRALVQCRDYFGNPWASYLYIKHFINRETYGSVESTLYQGFQADWVNNLWYPNPSVGYCYQGFAEGDDNLGTVQNATTLSICYQGPILPPTNPPQTCHTCGGSTEPLALDLSGDGVISTTPLSQSVHFDIDADGTKEHVTWLDPAGGDAFLWLDIHPNHQVDSGFELFGIGMVLPSGQRAASGFEALAAYDTPEMGGNLDGKIDVADHVWGRLRFWVDSNLDGVAQPREISTVAQNGIRAVDLQYEAGNDLDSNGNNHYFRSRFIRSSALDERSLPIHGLIFQQVPNP